MDSTASPEVLGKNRDKVSLKKPRLQGIFHTLFYDPLFLLLKVVCEIAGDCNRINIPFLLN